MQEIVVRLWCDAHQYFNGDDQKVEATTETLDLGDGVKEIELCTGCSDDLSMRKLREVVKVLGRDPEKPKRQQRRSTAGKAQPKGEFPCRFCPEGTGNVWDTAQGRGLHEFRLHPYQRLLWERQNDYKVDKGKAQDRRAARLALLNQTGFTLEQAAEKERSLGVNNVRHSQADSAADIFTSVSA